jgi:BirA family transcriptional regulator, biotin operon repressor / biotin---[acetyl-CoA-carboxylase] ligase
MKQEAESILFLDETESTNRFLTTQIAESRPANGFMAVAANQTSGRGQTGNVWESQPGKNLLCSTVFYPSFFASAKSILSFESSCFGSLRPSEPSCEGCFAKMAQRYLLRRQQNGGYSHRKQHHGFKIDTSVIGIGINVNQTTFSPRLPNPVSPALLCNRTFKVSEMAKQLQHHLMQWFTLLQNGNTSGIDSAYLDKLYRKNGEWEFSANGERFFATIQTVRPTGQLVLKTVAGIREFWFKEVEFVI